MNSGVSSISEFSTLTQFNSTEYSRYEVLINNTVFTENVVYSSKRTYYSFSNVVIDYFIDGQVYSEDLLDENVKYCFALEHTVNEDNKLTNIKFHILTSDYVDLLKAN